jgi:GNAT superfamily N-acetyltransferase
VEDVRVATSDDLADLVRMLEDAIRETPVARAGHLSGFPRRHERPPRRFAEALQSESQIAFVGLLETHAVGFALVVIDDGMPGGLLARVEELYVEPEAREVGIGEAMLDACVQWASEHGCAGIEVEALPGARSAKNLAERSGFTARLLILHRKL